MRSFDRASSNLIGSAIDFRDQGARQAAQTGVGCIKDAGRTVLRDVAQYTILARLSEDSAAMYPRSYERFRHIGLTAMSLPAVREVWTIFVP